MILIEQLIYQFVLLIKNHVMFIYFFQIYYVRGKHFYNLFLILNIIFLTYNHKIHKMSKLIYICNTFFVISYMANTVIDY